MKGILLDESGQAVLSGSAILIGDAEGQTIENILKANRGEFKEAPLIGGETVKMLGGTPNSMWRANIKKQIESIGIPVSRVEMNATEIIIKQ